MATGEKKPVVMAADRGAANGVATLGADAKLNDSQIPMQKIMAVANAAEYSQTQTYVPGAYCTRDGKLYRCTTAITTAETWTAGHWTETTVSAELVSIYTALGGKATILTSNLTIYVSTTGSDTTGDGSSGKPFRTIQHAIDSIPPVLNGNGVSIIVAAGTYDEDVVIRGKCASQGYRPISINGASSKAEAVNYKVRSIYVAGTGMACVNINGFNFTGHPNGRFEFYSYGDSCAYLSYCVLDSASRYGIFIGDRPYSHLCISDSTISNKTKSAISTEFGNIVQVYKCDGKNNAAVFKANGDQGFGGMIFDCGENTISGTVAEVKGYGGQIFK